jgi:hypothetical protein
VGAPSRGSREPAGGEGDGVFLLTALGVADQDDGPLRNLGEETGGEHIERRDRFRQAHPGSRTTVAATS